MAKKKATSRKTVKRSGRRVSRPEPDDEGPGYSHISAGEAEKLIQGPVREILFAARYFFVYVDPKNLIGYLDARPATDAGDGFSAVESRVTRLEAISSEHLSTEQLSNYKRLLATAMYHALNGDNAAALEMANLAEEYIEARNLETSRKWYLTATALTTAAFLLAGLLLWAPRDFAREVLGTRPAEVLALAMLGSLGALISTVLRLNGFPLEPSAGKTLHHVEASLRVAVGVVGSFVVLLGIEAGVLLGDVPESDNGLAIMAFLAVLSGGSERLLPHLMGRFVPGENGDPGPEVDPEEEEPEE